MLAPITTNVMSYHDMAMHQSLSLMTHCRIIPVVPSLGLVLSLYILAGIMHSPRLTADTPAVIATDLASNL